MKCTQKLLLIKDHYDKVFYDTKITDKFKNKALKLLSILYIQRFNYKVYKGYPVELIAEHLGLKNGETIKIINYLIDNNLIHRERSYNTGVNGKKARAKKIDLITDSLLYSKELTVYLYEYKKYKKSTKMKNIEQETPENKRLIVDHIILDNLHNILNEMEIDFDKLETIFKEKQSDTAYADMIQASLNYSCHNLSVSDKTRRIYSIATQMNGDMFKAVKIDGEELMSIDFANMHPALFANMLKDKIKTNDFKDFYKHATEGTFYKNLSEKLNIDIDTIKKKTWMIGVYGMESIKYNTYGDEITSVIENKHSQQIASIYPSFIKWVDEFKKKYNGKGDMANFIQREESRIMLDNIVFKLYNMGYKVIPRHDEIVIKKSEYNQIANILVDILKDLNLVLTIKTKI